MPLQEFVLDDAVVVVDDRVVEVLLGYSDAVTRIHVSMLGFEAFDPDKHGSMKIRIGKMVSGSFGAQLSVTTSDQAVRDACAIALEQARQRGQGRAAAG
jgi:hypothetical protein